MKNSKTTFLAILAIAAGASSLQPIAAAEADGAAAKPDKSGYTLFNPVPKEFMRELNTDRPDVTESPYTLDAGHFQLEMDLVNFTYDHDTSGGADVYTREWNVAPMNLKVGLCNHADLQLVIEPCKYVRTTDRVAGTKTIQRGFGDITTRLKINFWGDDGGATAFGVMPFAKFPTSQDGLGNHAVEGGIIFPLALNLPHGWDMGLMTEFDFNKNETGGNYHLESLNTITLGHDIIGKLGGYIEFTGLVSTEKNAPWVGTFDAGVTYGITENIQLDAGINFGVTKSAPDLQPFIGISIRL